MNARMVKVLSVVLLLSACSTAPPQTSIASAQGGTLAEGDDQNQRCKHLGLNFCSAPCPKKEGDDGNGDDGHKSCGTCVNLHGDTQNCGACGTVCPTAFACIAGACVLQCQASLTNCNGTCANTQSDGGNCGACGNACKQGQVCSGGACVVNCQPNETACGTPASSCANFQSDNANCGACGNVCGAESACTGGKCVITCHPGYTVCNSACTNTQADPANCGGCGKVCAPEQVCSANGCVYNCAGSQKACNGACTDLTTDNNNCNACGNVCPHGTVCSMGVCSLTCADSLNQCGTPPQCSNPATDCNNCGACGNACSGGQGCTNSVCVCPNGENFCNGLCSNPQSDDANCGKCGNACAGGQSCRGGACACTGMQTLCNGLCTDFQTNDANCGQCGNACPDGLKCVGGACTCGANLTACNNACTNIQQDPANCGKCGTACAQGQLCAGGACVENCGPGQTNCNAYCANTTNDSGNCGGCGVVCPGGGACQNSQCVAVCGRLLVIAGQLKSPLGVATDLAGNVYVADNGNARVAEFDSTGLFLRAIGVGTLASPFGVAINAGGDIFVSDLPGPYCQAAPGRVIDRFNQAGALIRQYTASGGPNGNGPANYPVALAFSPTDGTLWNANPFYIGAGCGPGDLQQLDTVTDARNDYGYQTGVSGPFTLTIDPANRLFYTDGTAIYGPFNSTWGATQPTVAKFPNNALYYMSAACDNTLWVADGGEHKVVQLSENGAVLTTVGGGGQFQTPVGVAAAYPFVWITDSAANTLTRYSACGTNCR